MSVKVIAHGVRNFCMLKNKYDFTLRQSRLHTASETFIRQKKVRLGSIFCIFNSIACILIGKDGEYKKHMRKFRTQCAMTFKMFMLNKCKKILHFYFKKSYQPQTFECNYSTVQLQHFILEVF